MLSVAHFIYAVQSRIHSDNLLSYLPLPTRKTGIDCIIGQYVHGKDTYRRIRDLLDVEMTRGLSRDENRDADVKMFVTYVQSLPDGSETGDYLALDLGGTNFRVLLISLKGSEIDMKNKIYPISEELMHGKGTALFDYIASCIAGFVKDHHLSSKSLPLGFTFSFPCRQESLAVGRLVQWTKGFCCEGVEGRDVVQLLQEAIHRRGDISVECVAILNDTVGCLMSCAFVDHNTQVGVILGTGSNACYVERLDRVEQWDGPQTKPRQVIINTEWGAFGDNHVLDFIRTPVDVAIDTESLNPGRQTFEKMISGMYMGEIARRVIVECAQAGYLFGGRLPEELLTPHRFYTKYVSEIEKDVEGEEFLNTTQILDELGVDDITPEDCHHVRDICKAVSERAAFLASAGIAALLNRINRPISTVAVDGSLYRFHPHFHNLMMRMTESLLNDGLKVRMMLSEDGSGKGAALVAAVAHRTKLYKQNSIQSSDSLNHLNSK